MKTMDDRFDDIVKNKLEGYEEPGFDPAALASLHHKIATVVAIPWYSRFRSELLTGSILTVLTLVILYSQWYWNDQNSTLLEREMSFLRDNHRLELNRLNDELNSLRNTIPDTIEILRVEERIPDSYKVLLDRFHTSEAERASLQNEGMIYLGNSQDLPSHVIRILRDAGYLRNDGTEMYLASTSNKVLDIPRKGISTDVILPDYYIIYLNDDEDQATTKGQNKGSKRISGKTARELNKHYQNGIGVRLGPSAELFNSDYKFGNAGINPAAGLRSEFVLSPSLSLETGVLYRQISSHITTDFIDVELPAIDPNLGELSRVDFDRRMLEVPFNLRYRYPISLNSNISLSSGYSALFYTTEDIEYSYTLTTGDLVGTVVKVDQSFDRIKSYPGIVNFSLGLDHRLQNNRSIEASLFYKRNVGYKGIEKDQLDIFGVRGTYWFSIKE